MRRKVIALLLCGTLAASVLAGCGSAKEEANAPAESSTAESGETAEQMEEDAETEETAEAEGQDTGEINEYGLTDAQQEALLASVKESVTTEYLEKYNIAPADFELLPYSLRELALQDVELAAHVDDAVQSPARQTRLQALLDAYLTRGGFPAAQGLPVAQTNALLQSYTRRVVARDVVERHDLARPRVASALASRLMGLNGRQLSVRRIENDLRSAGLATGRGYLGDLVSYFEEAYLVFLVRERSRALSESTTAPPKAYAIDPGLSLANSRAGASDVGQRLENAVYLELRRRHPELRDGGISTLRTKAHGYEVDFVVGDALDERATELVQVTDSMEGDRTAERETRALWEAMGELGVREGLIVVRSGTRARYERDGMSIEQIPAWSWLLSTEDRPSR